MGENNRKIETGYEQRIPVEKIIMHEKYRHFNNDLGMDRSVFVWALIKRNFHFFLVLMKLSRAANIAPKSRVKTIFLPSSAHIQINPNNAPLTALNHDNNLFERNENFLRGMELDVNKLIYQDGIKKQQASNKTQIESLEDNRNSTKVTKSNRHRRRNDKFLHRRPTTSADEYWLKHDEFASSSSNYLDCVAVGWGKYRDSEDLSDALLKIEVPIHEIKRYVDS